ncbi:MAG: small multi-drug export protein [Patescibacteria group bacterium]|nr:small multi-drug export protein [Patescibacteria group bacterium]
MSPQIQTILLSTLPINELRGTIPFAISVLRLSPLEAFTFSVIGNLLPIFFLLWFLPNLSQFLMKNFKIFHQFFSWLFLRTRNRFYKKYQKFGDLALVVFVAIPLPMTGAWTGAIASFLFGIPYLKSLFLIFVGILIAGLIVTFISTGFFTFIKII